MSSDLVAETVWIDPVRLPTVPTATLRAALAAALKLTASHLTYLAAIWGELEKRGEDLSELKSGIGFYLSRIAAGKLDAEIVVKYAGDPMLLRRAMVLEIEVQRGIVAGDRPPWEIARSPVAPPRPYPRAGLSGPASSHEQQLRDAGETPLTSAAVATPKELADMILRAVEKNPSPAEVARRLIPELERVVKGQARKFDPYDLED